MRAAPWVAAAVLLVGGAALAQRAALTQTTVPTTIVTGALADATAYTLVVPPNWNGTLFVDLDSTNLNSPSSNWLYSRGFARAGNSRDRIGSLVNRGAANLVETVDVFTRRFGAPKRSIISGSSLGGQVAAVAAFTYPDRFVGAIAHCAGLMGWGPYLNTNLDVAFTLKTLLAGGAELPLVHIPADDAALNEGWQSLINGAQKTAAGRARIALAAALGQAPVWTTREVPEPAATDVAARQEAAFRTVLDFSRQFTALRRRLEGPAGGATSWNTGVNYSAVFARRVTEVDRRTVEALYREADLSVEEDLAALDKAPRLAPEPAAIDFVRRLYPFDGKIAIPVMTLSNTGDPYVWSAIDSAYAEAVRKAGRQDLLRMTYVRSAGHCAFTEAERLASYQVLLERLDTGRWPDVTPAAMNARANGLQLGSARFWDYTPPAIERASLTP